MAKEPRFKRLEFEPGTIIIEEGCEGEAAYLITKGTVDIRTGLRSDNPQTVASMSRKEFGEPVKKMDPVLRGVVMQMVGRTRRMAERLNKSKERPDWYD